MGGPGLIPVSAAGQPRPASPLMAYRWAHTDAALRAQLGLESEGHPGVLEPGHAAVRFANPTTGGDALPTMRTELHRLRAGPARPAPAPRRPRSGRSSTAAARSGWTASGASSRRATCSSCRRGPPWSLEADTEFDLFRFSDAPIVEKLSLLRTEVTG